MNWTWNLKLSRFVRLRRQSHRAVLSSAQIVGYMLRIECRSWETPFKTDFQRCCLVVIKKSIKLRKQETFTNRTQKRVRIFRVQILTHTFLRIQRGASEWGESSTKELVKCWKDLFNGQSVFCVMCSSRATAYARLLCPFICLEIHAETFGIILIQTEDESYLIRWQFAVGFFCIWENGQLVVVVLASHDDEYVVCGWIGQSRLGNLMHFECGSVSLFCLKCQRWLVHEGYLCEYRPLFY